MALPIVAKFYHHAVSVTMADISTASSVFFAIPFRCKIVAGWVTIQNAITGSDSALTAKIGPAGATGTAITGFTGTAAVSGSAAGTVFTMATPTALNIANDGDNLELITDGASSTTAVANWTILLHRF